MNGINNYYLNEVNNNLQKILENNYKLEGMLKQIRDRTTLWQRIRIWIYMKIKDLIHK